MKKKLFTKSRLAVIAFEFLSLKKNKPTTNRLANFGGDNRTRTYDLSHVKRAH